MPVSSNGTKYALYGKGETVLVFIHGVGMNQQVWQAQVDYFSSQYRVLVYDILGHGASPNPAENVDLSDYVAQLEAMLKALGIDNVVLIGHSMGALISVAFALKNVNQVSQLVAMNITYKRSQAQSEAVMKRANKVIQDQQISGVETTLKRWFINKTDDESIKKIDLVRHWLAQANPLGYGRTYRLFAASDQIFSGKLKNLTMQVLYLTGADDANSSALMSQQMAGETPYGKALVIEDEAHMMAYISPEKINPMIEQFIRQEKLSCIINKEQNGHLTHGN